MNNISNIKDCYGCGVCTLACPQNIISVSLDSSGFYKPKIKNLSACTNCGLCLSVCSYTKEKDIKKDIISSYSAWSKDSIIRRKCSSGGFSFELGLHLLKKGYKICAVRYNVKKNRAEHYIAGTKEELLQSIGSKYIQSYTVDGFSSIKKKEKYLITGTPCQIDSFRRYIKKYRIEDNFILLDFFCHGVPSKLMWDKYLREVEKITGKITDVIWRNKSIGWHNSYNMTIKGEKNYYESPFSQGDLFYKMFLGNICLGKACYDKCKYKMYSSAADIRIGDMWGKHYKDNKDGVSAVITMTSKGEEIISEITNCEIMQLDKDIVCERQMKRSPRKSILYKLIIWALKSKHISLSVIKYSMLYPILLKNKITNLLIKRK